MGNEEYNAGKCDVLRELLLDFLFDLGNVTADLYSELEAISDVDILKELTKKAAKAMTMPEFLMEKEELIG